MIPPVAGTQNVHIILFWPLGHDFCTVKFTYLESMAHGVAGQSLVLSLLAFLLMATLLKSPLA